MWENAHAPRTPLPTLSPTDPVPRGPLTLAPCLAKHAARPRARESGRARERERADPVSTSQRAPPPEGIGGEEAKLAKFTIFFANFFKILQILEIFGGLVLGCIKTKFCKKICDRQHFSSSTRFAYFCTAGRFFYTRDSNFCTAQTAKFTNKTRHDFGSSEYLSRRAAETELARSSGARSC